MLAVCKRKGNFSDRRKNHWTPPEIFLRGTWSGYSIASTEAELHTWWLPETLPSPSPQQEWKNNRKAGPQETGGYDIRLIWGLQAYLSRAAGVTITDLKPRCGTARPTLWGGQGHANERGRSRPSLLFGWPVITNATWSQEPSLPSGSVSGVLREHRQRRTAGPTISFLGRGTAALMTQREGRKLPEALAGVCKLLNFSGCQSLL